METNHNMKTILEDKKTFIKPELEIIYFEGDLATGDVIVTSSFGDPDPKPGDINGWW